MKNKYARWLNLPLLVMLIAAMAGCQKMEVNEMRTDPFEESQVEVSVSTFSSIAAAESRYIVFFEDGAIVNPELEASQVSATGGPSVARLSGFSKDEVIRRDKLMWQESAVILKENKIAPDAIQEVFSGPVKGLAANLEKKDLEAIMADPRVKRVEEDKMIALNFGPNTKTPFIPSGTSSFKENSYGVKRVGGSVDFTQDPNYATKRVWILDTGIDIDHPDLNVDTASSRNFTTEASYDDGYGHGTHVAGIVGAKDDGIGLSGVAAGIKLVAVKVLNNQGIGYTSEVINGLSYIYQTANPGDVVNISIGGSASSGRALTSWSTINRNATNSTATINRMVMYLGAKGVHVAIAAGNDSDNANKITPAKVNYTNVYTVGSIDKTDTFSWFSNYGSCMDYVAPGESILSTYKDGIYGWMSGTSMATPHMAGVLAVTGGLVNTSGTSKGSYSYPIISR